jgi:hypothetical protein
LIIFDDEFRFVSIEFQIFPNKSTVRILIPASLAQTDDAVFAAERKTIEDQRKEKKTLTRLIISADFFKGKVFFVRLSFSASGLWRVEPNPVPDGKLSEQLEMKMRSSWSPQKNFHLFFVISEGNFGC